MRNSFFSGIAAAVLGLAATAATAKDWYVNDGSRTGDTYCTATGNDANDGQTPATPFSTIAKALTKVSAGDKVHVDTGTYNESLQPKVSGAADAEIWLEGSTNGTYVTTSGTGFFMQANHYRLENFTIRGGIGVRLDNVSHCLLKNCDIRGGARGQAIWFRGGGDLRVENCSLWGGAYAVNDYGRVTNSCIVRSVVLANIGIGNPAGWSLQESIVSVPGVAFSSRMPETVKNCLFDVAYLHGADQYAPDYATVEEAAADYPDWSGNQMGNPCFADAEGEDYHLLSPHGYMQTTTNAAGVVTGRSWVTDATVPYSPGIDAGLADSDYSNEPTPNGGRGNIGRYAGTGEASKSATGAQLRALTFTQGGRATGSAVLEWVSTGFAAGDNVRVAISTNAGATWTTLGTVAAASGRYAWTITAAQESPRALWRVTSAKSAAVSATNGMVFSARSGGGRHFDFYVNDGSRTGDVYCMATGQAANDGLTPATPKASLADLLATYSLGAGDRVYVDTGTYADETPAMGMLHRGAETAWVKISGSTNGTVLDRNNLSQNALTLDRAEYVELENLTLKGGRNGLLLTNGTAHVRVEGCTMMGNYTGLSGLATDLTVKHSVFANNTQYGFWGTAGVLDHCVAYGNRIGLGCTTNTVVSNSAIAGSGTSAFAHYQTGAAAVPQGDYNAMWGNDKYTQGVVSLQELQGAVAGWTHSFAADPQFVDGANGDFHLKAGSALIDAGDPASTAYTNEPSPNGGRVNIGAYGGTSEAATSPAGAWLQAYTFNDGGTLDAQAGQTLQWNGGGYAQGATATIWLSRDDGESWEALATGVDVASGSHVYRNTDTNDPSALNARWKITLDGAEGVASTNLSSFLYSNGAFHFYLNDESTDGDVYCTAPGDDGNSGVSRDAPKRTLSALLGRYEMKPGDCIYIDTGGYNESATVAFGSADTGTAEKPLRIIGSTNRAAGGTQYGWAAGRLNRTCMSFGSGAAYISLSDIVFTNMTRGIEINQAEGISLEGVEMRGVDTGVSILGNSRRIDIRHSAFHGCGTGMSVANATEVVLKNNAFVDPKTAGLQTGAGAEVTSRNNLFSGDVTGSALLVYTPLALPDADYDGWNAEGSALVAKAANDDTVRAANLAELQNRTGLETHGVPGDPLLADKGAFDYHLKTAQTLGRKTERGWTSDLESSPLLDAGDPADAVGEEPEHNGGRINIGRWGGTAEASKSLSTPWLQAVTFADGGSVGAEAVTLRWVCGGGLTGKVNVDVTRDGGKTWRRAATGVTATNCEATWNPGGLADTPAAMWKVTSATAGCSSTNGVFFGIRKAPLTLYVATVDTNENVYVTGPGAADNYEATAAAPMDSLQHVVDLFDLEAGDTVYVDHGLYESVETLVVGVKDSGTPENPVRFVGDTNAPYGSSVLKHSLRTVGRYLVDVSGAYGVEFEALAFSNAWSTVLASNCTAVTFRHCLAGHASTNAVNLMAGADCTFRSTLVAGALHGGLNVRTGAVAKVYNCYIRDNTYGICLTGGDVDVQNSILRANGLGHYVYNVDTASGTLESDYNDVLVENSAGVGVTTDGGCRFLIDWQRARAYENDKHSFGADPGFADEEEGDYHLRSEHGRHVPGGWEQDEETSALIDMGNPSSAHGLEPTPNGGRINIGLYGNTVEASKSGGTGSLVPLTMSDGGTIRGDAVLYWSYNGFADNTRVNVLFSDNGGQTWEHVIASGIYINQDGLAWATTNYPSTAMGAWKIELASNTNIFGQTQTPFALKNDPVKYYVNDASTEGDLYCTAAGHSGNNGLSPATPIHSLEALLGRYKVEGGDTVYVDTGIYRQSSALTISVSSPEATTNLLIQGSTNELYGGSVFTNSAGGAVWSLQDTSGLEVRDVRLAGGNVGMTLARSASNLFRHVRVEGSAQCGYYLGERADQNRFVQCAALNMFQTGLFLARPLMAQIPPGTNYWDGGVMISAGVTESGANVSTGRLFAVQAGRMYVSNSVFVAAQPSIDVYDVVSGGLAADYNLYHLPYKESALARESLGNTYGVETRTYRTQTAWTDWSGCDGHSLMGDPLFADAKGGDLHPKSEGGRYNPLRGEWTADTETSPLIDTGDPAAPYGAEGAPNGGRLDMGYYGNDPCASHAPTNRAGYVLQTLNQGGVASGTVELRWIPQGVATNAGQTVNVLYSTNSGANWVRLAGPVAANAGIHRWTYSASRKSCPTMRWQVQCPTNQAWAKASEADFILHDEALKYYVNDADRTGDVYCTAAGSAENDGQTPATPMDSLTALLERYDLEPGDTVYMDSGDYRNERPVRWGYMDAGTAAQPVVLAGSTNPLVRTRFLESGLALDNAAGVAVRDVLIGDQTRGNALQGTRCEDLTFERVDVRGSPGHGIYLQSSSNVTVRNFSVTQVQSNGVALHAPFGVHLESGTVVSNVSCVDVWNYPMVGMGGTNYNNSHASATNCTFGASGYRMPVYQLRGNLTADYNNYELKDGALVAISTLSKYSKEYDSVGNWTQETGLDAHTLSVDPRYRDSRNGDFHLLAGSELIDAGNPLSPYANEPSPNGGRINIGRYGNTAEAAKSPLESGVTLVSYRDGGKASGTNALVTWVFRGTNTSETLSIYYSADAGAHWTLLAAGVSASSGNWTWNTETCEPSVQAKLKLVTSGGAESQSSGVFSARNQPFQFYVNDSSRKGDVYCTSVGSATNDGLTPSTPMADLNRLLEKYDLEAGDTVYVDTGTYDSGLTPWRISQTDSAGLSESGEVNEPAVVIQGATNSLLGGTVLNRNGQGAGIQVDNAAGLVMRNILVTNTSDRAVAVNGSYGVTLEWMAASGAETAFALNGGSQLEMRHCVALNSQRGVNILGRDLRMTNHVPPRVENCLLWGQNACCVEISPQNIGHFRNNLFSVGSGGYIYQLDMGAEFETDYNGLYLAENARVYKEKFDPLVLPLPAVYETLGAWAAASGQDLHSYDGDPLFADEAGNDYHLKSQAGRRSGTQWVKDPVSSPLLDAGDPASDWSGEPAPNGGRINIGLYGGSAEASKTSTNRSVRLLTLNRGGVASGLVAFNWLSAGYPDGTLFDLEVSMDNGATWTAKGQGIAAELGGVQMNSSSWGASPVCRWRLSSGGTVLAESEECFVLHNGGIAYYVNDSGTVGDVYCTAGGASTNNGYQPSSPKRNLQEILDAYNLEPGDTVYVDTGDYHMSEPVVWGDLDGGSMDQNVATHVRLQGSTNAAYGGTRFLYADDEAHGIVLTNVCGVTLAHLTQIGGGIPLSMQECFFNRGEWLTIQGASNAMRMVAVSNQIFEHCVLKDNQKAVDVSNIRSGAIGFNHCVAWSNGVAFRVDWGWLTVSNSIVGNFGKDTYAYYIMKTGGGYVQGDYNNLYQENGGKVAGYQEGSGASSRTSSYASVSTWYTASGNDLHSLGHEPKMADPGAGDYHLKSAGGRLAYGGDGQLHLVYDTESSPLIDAGNPGDMRWANEPSPNGRRLNIGLYGGTEEASRTAMSGWVTVLSLNDGGTVAGDVDLQWAAGGAATNYTVCLEYSPDRGKTWQNIVCGIPAMQGHYLWASDPYGRSALGMWRLYCVENAAILAQCQTPFVLRNGGSILYYVNDAHTEDDVYCTEAGNDEADGLTSETPKASIQAILDEYELSPSDVILVDAGVYDIGTPITIGQEDSGYTNAAGEAFYVTIRGSTNPAAATLLTSPALGMECVVHLDYAEYVRLSNLTIRHAMSGVWMDGAIGCRLENVRIMDCNNSGLRVDNFSKQNEAENSVFWNNQSWTGGVAVAISRQSDAGFRNCVMWESPTAVKLSASSVRVTNSVLFASGSEGRIYSLDIPAVLEAVEADYNCYYVTNTALLASKDLMTGGSEYYNLLPAWQGAIPGATAGRDRHSMQGNPRFANARTGDFHLDSPYGQYPDYVPSEREKSELIDAGDPKSPYENEPMPNGGNANIGAYGNSPQASLSGTNAWVHTVSYNDGGTMTGDVLLSWTYGGMPAGTKVRLAYSLNDGFRWTTIAEHLEVGTREYAWDVSQMPLCLTLLWKIEVEDDTEIFDESDNYIVVKTQNYDYFVNDESRDGDVYCTAPGSFENTGTNAASPAASVGQLLEMYPVGAGDRIFIDTGIYDASTPVTLGTDQSGTAEMPLEIHGSTNWAKGGSLFLGSERLAPGMVLRNVRHVELHDLRFTGSSNAVYLANADKVVLSGVESFDNEGAGIRIESCGEISADHLLLAGNAGYGFESRNQKAAGRIANSTIAGNEAGCLYVQTMEVEVWNSILSQANEKPIYQLGSLNADVTGDYNLFEPAGGGNIAENKSLKAIYGILKPWQDRGRDRNSWVGDPLFVDAEGGDYHLQSRAGYWTATGWKTSGNTSWAIDAGNPETDADGEPTPNGNRVNMGRYGGTSQASKTDNSKGELFAVSLRDGGTEAYGDILVWLFRGFSATNNVLIQYAPDGENWVTVDRVGIGAVPYEWRSNDEPSPESLWRVVLEGDTNVTGATETTFIFRPSPLKYYVNDGTLAGDVYTTAAGSAENNGYRPNSPMDSISRVLARYSLSGGDTVYVDTGTYPLSESLELSSLHSGTAEEYVKFTGSTNVAAGGSKLTRMEGVTNAAFTLMAATCIELSNLRVSGFTNGVYFGQFTEKCTLDNVDVEDSYGAGVAVDQARDILLKHVAIRNGAQAGLTLESGTAMLDGCVIWGNQGSAVYFGTSSTLNMTNSVLEASKFGNYCYESPTNITLRADYNDLFLRDNAQVGFVDGVQYEKLPQWVKGMKQDVRSLSTDPLFHDPDNGDFHLRSAAGRYEPGKGWVKDAPEAGVADYSPLIDMGSTNAFDAEPPPNGGRINIGRYGNTEQASKSNTNAWLQAVTAMSGGLTYGTFYLIWGWGGDMAADTPAQLWYSYDDGRDNWVFIDNVTVGDGMYYWDSAKTQAGSFRWPTSPAARWKIFLTGDTNVWDMTEARFGLRNSPFTYYLNDGSQANDVYTTAVGDDGNLGCFPAGPKLTLQALLEEEDMEPTDRILVDTGLYVLGDTNHPVLWESSDSGTENAPVTLTGSPNGSTFRSNDKMASGYILKSAGEWVEVHDVAFEGGGVEFEGAHVAVSNLTVSNGYLAVSSAGATVTGGAVHRGGVTLAGKDIRVAGLEQRMGSMTLSGTNAVLENVSIVYTNRGGTALVARASGAVVSNSTVVATAGTALSKLGTGPLTLGHNILVASGEGNAALEWLDGSLTSDWNDLVARNGAWVGAHNEKWERLEYWKKATGKDANSISAEPKFQNEAGGDLHLNSLAGRWRPSDGSWTTDSEHSPAIDAGNPYVGTGFEPLPNGYRRNLGAYGGTEHASKSVTNAWVQALTANDGGVLKGPAITLRWSAGNASGMSATIQYSADGGATWTEVASGVPAMATADGGSYTWTDIPTANSFEALWKITLDGTQVSDTTDTPFNLRMGPQQFYVNDASRTGDIYCTKAGFAGATGRAKSSPMLTLKELLDAYDLEGGDTVYVDTGTYTMASNTAVIWSRSGEEGRPVTIQGNTNDPSASEIYRTGVGGGTRPAGLEIHASNVEVAHLGFAGDEYAEAGVLLSTNSGVTLTGLRFRGGLPYGIDAQANTNLSIRNSVFWKNQTGARVRFTRNVDLANLTFALPTVAALQLASLPGENVIENNIYVPAGAAQVYNIGGAEDILANAEMDYNLYDFGETSDGSPNFYLGAPTTLMSWQLKMRNDFRSAITNADLADVVWGDMHPKSAAGRWTAPGRWTNDAATSWAVDHGNPYPDVGAEPTPNANRANVGAYGGTVQASKSVALDAYDLRTLSDTSQTLYPSDEWWPLVWSAELLGTNKDVIVWFSNSGTDTNGWIQLAQTDAMAEYCLWKVFGEGVGSKFLTGQGHWLITDLDGNILAMSEKDLTITLESLRISEPPADTKGMMRFKWRGGLGGQHYWILYSDDGGQSWRMWERKYNGPAKIHRSDFTLTEGETESVFEDRTSYGHRMRWYTITTNDPTAFMTNGVYVP